MVETNYRVGEFIEDAQLLKIFADKALVIRSNGQQEMLYLREDDAAQDLELENVTAIQSGLIFNIEENVYAINMQNFVMKVSGLGQFIDMLGLITVYNQGEASGCRVGIAGDGSLGAALGLQEGDIIEAVAGNSVTDLNSRLYIYDEIMKKDIGDSISLKVRRSGISSMKMYYLIDEARSKVLSNNNADSADQMSGATSSDLTQSIGRSDYEIESQRREILSRKVAMAPTRKQIEAQY